MLSRTYFVVLSSLLLTSLIGIGCGSVHSNLKASQQIEVFRLKLSKAALNAFRTTPPPKSFNLEDFSKPTDENIAKGTATANVQIDISPLRTRNTDVKSAIDAAGLRIDLNNTITLRLRANYSVNARYDIYNNKRGGQHARIGSVYNHEFNGQVDTLIFLKGSGPIDRRIVKAIPIATGETNPDTFSYRAHFAQVRTGSRFANFGRWVAGDRIARRIANDSIPNDAPETFKKQVPPAVAEEVATQIDEYLKSGNNGFATLLNYLTEKNELPGTMRVSSSPTDAYFSIFMDSDEAQDSIPFKREYRTINQVNNTNGDISVFVHEYLLSSFFQKNVYTRDFVTENYFVNVFTGSAFNKKYTGETGSSGLATLKFNRQYPKFVKIEDGHLSAHVAARYKVMEHLRQKNQKCNEDDVLLRLKLKLTNLNTTQGSKVIVSVPSVEGTSITNTKSGLDWKDAVSLLDSNKFRDVCQPDLGIKHFRHAEIGVAALPRVGADLGSIVYPTPRKVFAGTAKMFLEHNKTSVMNYIPFGLTPGSDAILQPNSAAEKGWLSLHWNMGQVLNKRYLNTSAQTQSAMTQPAPNNRVTYQRPSYNPHSHGQQPQQSYQPVTNQNLGSGANQPVFVRPTLPHERNQQNYPANPRPGQTHSYPNQGTYINQNGTYAYPGTHPNDQSSWRR